MTLFEQALKEFPQRMIASAARADKAYPILGILLPCGKVLIHRKSGGTICYEALLQRTALKSFHVPHEEQVIGQIVSVHKGDSVLEWTPMGYRRDRPASLLLEAKDILWCSS